MTLKIPSRPPYAAPSWGRWVKGKDGWMLHEKFPGAKKKKGKNELKIKTA